MDLEKYIRPDGSTYWAIAPADPNDKVFVEQLQPADVFPKKKTLGILLIAALIVYSWAK